MTHPSKRKGNDFERKLVKMAESQGLSAKRAWGSDGQALGRDKECDIEVAYNADPAWHGIKGALTIQAKKSKAHPEWPWKGLENVDVLVIGRNRKPPLAILPYEKLLELLQ